MGSFITRYLNFYRIHLLLFVLIPLLGAAVFVASNGEFKITYIDALYVCVSAATGCGLTTIDLSSTTAWQQTIIVILELTGNQAFVSWVVVIARRQYFRSHLEHIVLAESERRSTRHTKSITTEEAPSLGTFKETLMRKGRLPLWTNQSPKMLRRDTPSSIRPDMIRKTDIAPRLISPMGVHSGFQNHDDAEITQELRTTGAIGRPPRSLPPACEQLDGFGGFPGPQQLVSRGIQRVLPGLHRRLRRSMTMPRTETLIPDAGNPTSNASRTVSTAKRVPYISFSAIVSRNSAFRGLSAAQLEELGGVEYCALSALLWIVPLYYLGLLTISFVVIAPYMTLPRWRSNFFPPQQHRKIDPVWFSAFQIVGAWANTGMSLVDQNMIPFRTAYLMIVFLVLCVLAGNTAFVRRIRISWILTKFFPSTSRTKESLHFLLDHPRRCFIYLFPSYQTWLLFGILMLLNVIDWMFDLILNIGNPATDKIPIGTRLINAVLAAAAVRNAGYQSVAVATFTPAVQVLYVIMMYIAIYPIALGVRSTNVYEEDSVGIYDFGAEIDMDVDFLKAASDESRVQIWGKYLLHHISKQLTFDMWWLALSIVLLCIIERGPLMNTNNASWFNVFALLFELVSAYGTVGLSLGIPTANYSLSGALHTLSKLILCAVMIRGRHRGLPVALDRAVLLPKDLQRPQRPDPAIARDGKEAVQAHDPEQQLGQGEKVHETPRKRTRTLSFTEDLWKDAGRGAVTMDDIAEGEQRDDELS
ncbi:TrkH-domain-containing protein [Amylocystis lapponica]|nr:TrkH-domain-containing protein [Amylocystis lapponica]